MAAGTDMRLKQMVERCMAEYDLDGWTAPDLVNTEKLSVLNKGR
jgi:4-hydroxyphenylacetate 3-monooxygenase